MGTRFVPKGETRVPNGKMLLPTGNALVYERRQSYTLLQCRRS
jgi:hypothetical protein